MEILLVIGVIWLIYHFYKAGKRSQLLETLELQPEYQDWMQMMRDCDACTKTLFLNQEPCPTHKLHGFFVADHLRSKIKK